jgi:hypothetical protein
MFFQLEIKEMEIDVTHAQIKIQNLHIMRCTAIKEEQLTKINLGSKKNFQ